MRVLQGNGMVERQAVGTLRFLRRNMEQPPQDTLLTREQEWERFLRAQKVGVLELAGMHDRALQDVGSGIASIFAVHAMLLEDEELTQMVHDRIFDQGTSAEYAVWKTGTDVVANFQSMDNPYMKARGADILDIACRVLRIFRGEEPMSAWEEPTILVADALLPSEIMEANGQGNLVGVIARKGTPDSHTGHLLQAYGIGAVVDAALEERWEGHAARIDGCTGEIFLDSVEDLLMAETKR